MTYDQSPMTNYCGAGFWKFRVPMNPPNNSGISCEQVSIFPRWRLGGKSLKFRPTMDSKLNLLGNSTAELPQSRQNAVIETFPNPSPGRNYWIRLSTREFTSNCPETGQPDFGKLTIRYIPDEKCVETKSLKFYLNAYRHESCFNETAVNWITDDLVKACAPKELIVQGSFASRGGIAVQVETHYPDDHQNKPQP